MAEIIRGRGEPGLQHARLTYTFTGEATTDSPITMFTITGRVLVTNMTAFCTTLLGVTGTPVISLGDATDVDGFIAATTAANIDANEWWGNATPAAGSVNIQASTTAGAATALKNKACATDIVLTMTGAGASVDSGVVVFDAWYFPVTDNGALA